jgi:hypothetical protein
MDEIKEKWDVEKHPIFAFKKGECFHSPTSFYYTFA